MTPHTVGEDRLRALVDGGDCVSLQCRMPLNGLVGEGKA